MRIILYIILTIFLFNCNIDPPENQLTITLSGDPKSLDPAHVTDVRSGQVTALIYDNLVRFGYGTDIIPGLAESWEINNNGLVYTFILKDSIFFHDGDLLTSLNVKKSFEHILNPEINSRNSWIFRDVVGSDLFKKREKVSVSGFEIINDSKFRIILSKPFAPFLGFLAMPSASIVKILDNNIIGTGPWELKEWIRDGHLLFSANRQYFNGNVNLEKLKIRILPEAFPRVAEFITGYLDIMEIPNSEYELWLKDPEWNNKIQYVNQLNSYYIGMNCSRPPFDDVKVRQAVNYAVNVPQIIESIFYGRGQESGGPVPPVLLDRQKNPTYGYNIKLAESLLLEAGYDNGISVELWQSQSRELFQITEIIQEQLKQIGVDVKIIRNDWNMYSDAVRNGIPDMYYRSWWADYPDAENFLAPLFESEVSKKRWTRYENSVLDSMIVLLQNETDYNLRIQIARICNDILKNDAPWIYLWHMESALVIQPNLLNWKPSVMFNAEKYIEVAK